MIDLAPMVRVAALGDSITAGSPLWDPDPAVRARIGAALDERSQWEWWAARAWGGLELWNCGVYGERAEEIEQRLEACVAGVFHATLEDPDRPGRMREEWTDDGDHPSVEGYRRLGELAFRPPAGGRRTPARARPRGEAPPDDA
jgi:lysophospholipase L1-like esterase